jgi:hypothetical protein
MNNENINSNLEQAQINLNNGENTMNENNLKTNENELNEKSYRACYVCSYCKNCYYDSEGIPRCRMDENFDISENGEMKDWKFSKDPECPCDCVDFEGMDCCDDEPDFEYDDYDGRYDYCPSIFDRL